ncbi:MAG TPA: Gfo/Idh/MocA family oxidoreductase [Caulobacteraceae bacterium]|jgi:predicted dehydrogenase
MPQSTEPQPRRRYAIVGLGVRAYLYLMALTGAHREDGELVGLCDSNAGRLARAAAVAARSGVECPTYDVAAFERMLAETRADAVIVTSPDFTHADYIVRALQSGCDVVTEKPLTIDADSCRRIFAAREASGRSVTVGFNYRYSPARTLTRQVLASGVIGAVTAVNFEWRLDTHHGADYFRRWHRHKRNSGGLLVHKATHHFDLINWWLGSTARQVRAEGRRVFYRPETADQLGLGDRGERCTGCPAFARCPVKLDVAASRALTGIYADNEGFDGYFRDRCVFAPEIDIEDTMRASLDYESGAQVNYLLTAYNPGEGYRVVFHGERGELTLETIERPYVEADGSLPRPAPPERTTLVLQPLFNRPFELQIPQASGDHGGGDALMLSHLFRGGDDPLGRAADHRAGAWSALVGIAANASIASGGPIRLADIAVGIDKPDPNPAHFGPQPPRRTFDPSLYPFMSGAKLLS